MQNNFRISNMSNFAEEFEEDTEEELQNTSLSQSYSASTTPVYGGNDHTFKPVTLKKKRNHPGNPDPNAEVVALSPRTLMARNTYVCEVCHKGFQRDQNLQLHRRGHNLPWKLKQKSSIEARKKVYICPEQNCVHHGPSRALGDLTGIKKHFCRKHGEKKWKCEKCAKRYAVQSDWKAHMKICGTREYHCDCGTIFSRKDSFVTHRAFCDALAIENYRVTENLVSMGGMLPGQTQELFSSSMLVPNMSLAISNQTTDDPMRSISLASGVALSTSSDGIFDPNKPVSLSVGLNCLNGGSFDTPSPYMSATALLQKATEMGSKVSDSSFAPSFLRGFTGYSSSTMSSNGSLQEISCMVNHTTNTDSYVGNQNVFEHDLVQPRSMDIMQDSGAFNHRYMDSPLAVVHSKIGETTNMLRGDSNGGGEKMTVDFLGVGAAGHLISEEDKSCDMDTIGLTYSERQHMYSEWLSRPS